MIGDGQATSGGGTVVKSSVRKVQRIHNDEILVGYAGATADAMALLERFENKLQENQGNLVLSAVSLAKDWRTDRYLRNLQAQLAVADAGTSLLISGNGDVLEPEHDILAIGSGGEYARSAALALLQHTELDALDIARAGMTIAAEICIYTNGNWTEEVLDAGPVQ